MCAIYTNLNAAKAAFQYVLVDTSAKQTQWKNIGFLTRVGKNPGFFKKTQPGGFFWVLLGFFGFYWVF